MKRIKFAAAVGLASVLGCASTRSYTAEECYVVDDENATCVHFEGPLRPITKGIPAHAEFTKLMGECDFGDVSNSITYKVVNGKTVNEVHGPSPVKLSAGPQINTPAPERHLDIATLSPVSFSMSGKGISVTVDGKTPDVLYQSCKFVVTTISTTFDRAHKRIFTIAKSRNKPVQLSCDGADKGAWGVVFAKEGNVEGISKTPAKAISSPAVRCEAKIQVK